MRTCGGRGVLGILEILALTWLFAGGRGRFGLWSECIWMSEPDADFGAFADGWAMV